MADLDYDHDLKEDCKNVNFDSLHVEGQVVTSRNGQDEMSDDKLCEYCLGFALFHRVVVPWWSSIDYYREEGGSMKHPAT